MPRPSAILFAAALGLILSVAGCSSKSSEPGNGVPPGHTLIRFSMASDGTGAQDFMAATDDSAVVAAVQSQLALPPGQRTMFIIGPIERGSAGHNLAWRWHFVPGEWQLAETAIELCDGNPMLVDADVDYWVDTVGQFCPWGSYPAEITSLE